MDFVPLLVRQSTATTNNNIKRRRNQARSILHPTRISEEPQADTDKILVGTLSCYVCREDG